MTSRLLALLDRVPIPAIDLAMVLAAPALMGIIVGRML